MLWLANAGTSTAAPHDDFWYEPTVRAYLRSLGAEGAMRISTVYRCVHLNSQSIAQSPLVLYRRRADGGKDRVTEHPLVRLLALQPNPLQTAFEFRQMLQAHIELRGNAYAWIQYEGARVVALWPMHPDRVKVELLPEVNRLRYTWTPKGRPQVVLNQDDVLHVRGLESDGYVGINPIESQRRAIEFSTATSAFGQRTYAADAVQRGWVEHPNNFKDQEAREQYRGTLSRQLNDGKVPILEYGLKYHEVGMKLTDAQFIENRKYSDAEIASRIFGVPPHKIGLLDKATWANIESLNIEYVQDAVMPRSISWEQRLNATLLTEEEQGEYFFKFNLDILLRGDSTSRAAFYEKMLKNRVYSPNEVREREDMNPAWWGDEPLPMPNESLRGGEGAADSEKGRVARLERSAAQAVVQKEVHQLHTFAAKLEGRALVGAVQSFYDDDLAPFVVRVLSTSRDVALQYAASGINHVTAAIDEGRLVELLAEWKSRRVDQLLEAIRHA